MAAREVRRCAECGVVVGHFEDAEALAGLPLRRFVAYENCGLGVFTYRCTEHPEDF